MPNSSDVRDTVVRSLAELRAMKRFLLEVIELQHHEDCIRRSTPATQLLADASHVLHAHVYRIDQQLGTLNGSAEALRVCTASIAGKFVGFICKTRSHNVPNILREDYTLLSLMSVSCRVLQTAATALHQPGVATLARELQAELVPLLEEFTQLMPQVVYEDLSTTFVGLNADTLRECPPASRAPIAHLNSTLAATA